MAQLSEKPRDRNEVARRLIGAPAVKLQDQRVEVRLDIVSVALAKPRARDTKYVRDWQRD